MTELMSTEDIALGWSVLDTQSDWQHVRPLTDARRRFIDEAQSDRRVHLGIERFDREMRGISPGHLAFLVGYSHSGKTLVTTHVVAHNHDRRIAWFIPDEPAPLVLTKLTSLLTGIPAWQLEGRVAAGDRDAVELLDTTVDHFPHLVIFDQPLTAKLLRNGLAEVHDHWGDPADLVVVDYLDLVQIGTDLAPKANFIKTVASEFEVPMLVLHQTSRAAGTAGRPMRIDSGNFGGETWATYQLGVWRKAAAIYAELSELQRKPDKTEWQWDRITALEYQARMHTRTVTVNLNKNKRPGGELVEDGIDFHIAASGALSEMEAA